MSISRSMPMLELHRSEDEAAPGAESVARYLLQLETADRQAAAGGDATVLAARVIRLKNKVLKLKDEIA